MRNGISLLAIIPHGLEQSAAIELEKLGAKLIKINKGIISCDVDLACFYRLHLQARIPFRFFREICKFKCYNKTTLYKGVQNNFDLKYWLNPAKSFRVDVSGSTGDLNHTHFTSLQVKNALIDQQRKIWGNRSNVDLNNPDIYLHLHLFSDYATISLVSSSTSLHKRGYKAAVGIAPLKENIAAGLLDISNWESSLTLVDPLCGSATFLIEAASIARGIAPGLNRSFIFEKWPDFESNLWAIEKRNAKNLYRLNDKLPRILGIDSNNEIVNQAKNNICNAGLKNDIEIYQSDFLDFKLPESTGIIVCNPPYGKRLGNQKELEIMYKNFGNYLKQNASGWDLWILNGNSKLTPFLGMKCTKRFPITNGGINCRWMHYKIH